VTRDQWVPINFPDVQAPFRVYGVLDSLPIFGNPVDQAFTPSAYPLDVVAFISVNNRSPAELVRKPKKSQGLKVSY
jgi:hypothetical protein